MVAYSSSFQVSRKKFGDKCLLFMIDTVTIGRFARNIPVNGLDIKISLTDDRNAMEYIDDGTARATLENELFSMPMHETRHINSSREAFWLS